MLSVTEFTMGDRWIAATAIRLDLTLISHEGIFIDAPGLRVITDTV